jgi:polysaccharide biosynthesis transport protein
VSTEIIKTESSTNTALPAKWHQMPQVAAPAVDDTVLDLGGVFRLLRRRRGWILSFVALFVAGAAAMCILLTPRYKATAQVELLKQEQGMLSTPNGDGQTQAGATQAEDALNFSLSLQTAVSVLQSDALAVRVIKELNLENDKDFAYKPLPYLNGKGNLEAELPMEQSPVKRTYILKRWSKHLKVQSVAGTRVIELSFSHPDPQVASQIVNRLLADYIDYRYELRYSAAQKSTEWLNAKLAAVKEQAESSANRLAQASKAIGAYGGSDAGHSLVVNRLDQLNAALTQAQSTRAAKEAVYNLARSGDPELVVGMVGSGSQGATQSGGNAPYLLINLRQQEADLNAQYAEAAVKYGTENPKLIQIKNKLETARSEIKAETDKILGRARQEYNASVSAEQAANRALEDEKRLAGDLNEREAAYGIAKHESDSAQDLYQRLLETARETPILAGIRSTDVNIVNPAIPPGKPASPIVPLYLAAGALLGGMFGVVGAFVRDSMDTSLRNPEDIESITQLPVLGVIPRAEFASKKRRKPLKEGSSKRSATMLTLGRLTASEAPASSELCASDSLVMEAFRAARSSLLLSRPDNPHRIIMTTSSQPGEGKSFSSLHLAVALAQNGGNVLLVDGDLRRGTLSRGMKMSSRSGLSTLIAGTEKAGVYREVGSVPGLTFLPAGATPPNPAELIGSKRMARLADEWRQKFDYVVIDSPPVLPVTDAVVLSRLVDGVLLVVRFAVSKQQAITRTVRTLMGVRAECFGILVNDMDTRSSEYGYYGSQYGNETDDSVIDAEPKLVAALEEK